MSETIELFIENLDGLTDVTRGWMNLRGIVADARRNPDLHQGVDAERARRLFVFMGSVVADNPLTARQVAEAVNLFVSRGHAWSEAFNSLSAEELARFRFDRLRSKTATPPRIEVAEFHPPSPTIAVESPVGTAASVLHENPVTPEVVNLSPRLTTEVSELLRSCEEFMERKDKELSKFSFPDTQSITKTFAMEFSHLSHVLSSLHIKIAVVGETRAGKSCLAAALVGFPYIPRPSRFTINYHHVQAEGVTAHVPLDLVQFLAASHAEAMASENWAEDISGVANVSKALRKISDLLTVTAPTWGDDFEIDIYLTFPGIEGPISLTLVDPASALNSAADLVEAAQMVVFVVDASREVVPDELIQAVNTAIRANKVARGNLHFVLNKIDSCLEDPSRIREEIKAMSEFAVDASARTSLLECLNSRAESQELRGLRRALLGRSQRVLDELPRYALGRAQSIMAEFLEKLAVLNANQSPIDIQTSGELELALADTAAQFVDGVDVFVSDFFAELTPSVDVALLEQIRVVEGGSDRVVYEAVRSFTADVFSGWSECAQGLVDELEEKKADLMRICTSDVSDFCAAFSLDGSYRIGASEVLQTLNATAAISRLSVTCASGPGVEHIVGLAKKKETTTIFASSGRLKRWEFASETTEEVTDRVWADFVSQVKADVVHQWTEFCHRGIRALVWVIYSSPHSRVSLSADDSEFIEKLASLKACSIG